ncbi:protein-glutamate methylesterase CheB [Vibrio cholerae]|nr:protein-glutamate methylesterase CheB [Vibrio cholerae]
MNDKIKMAAQANVGFVQSATVDASTRSGDRSAG